eukprot:1884496-Karenia_brevis.AAC.1
MCPGPMCPKRARLALELCCDRVQRAQSVINSSKIGLQRPPQGSSRNLRHSGVRVKGNKILGHMAVSSSPVAICSTSAFRCRSTSLQALRL